MIHLTITVILILFNLAILLALQHTIRWGGNHYIFGGYIKLKEFEKALFVLSEANNGAKIEILSSPTQFSVYIKKVVENYRWYLELEISKNDYERISKKDDLGIVTWKKFNKKDEPPKYIKEKLKINLGYDLDTIMQKISNFYQNDFGNINAKGVHISFLNTQTLIGMDDF